MRTNVQVLRICECNEMMDDTDVSGSFLFRGSDECGDMAICGVNVLVLGPIPVLRTPA